MPRNSTRQKTQWLDPNEQQAWLALIEVGSGLFDTISADLKEIADLTLEDYEVLHLLSAAESHRLRVGEMANQMLASRTRLSQRLDRMTARGLVRRERCPTDGRAINVVLTAEGFELLKAVAPDHVRSVRERVFDHLDPVDVEAIGKSLGKLADYLREKRSRG